MFTIPRVFAHQLRTGARAVDGHVATRVTHVPARAGRHALVYVTWTTPYGYDLPHTYVSDERLYGITSVAPVSLVKAYV